MANQITSVVGFLSGTVTYVDGSVGNFNTNIHMVNNKDYKWATNLEESKKHLANIFGSSKYHALMSSTFTNMPYFDTLEWDLVNEEDEINEIDDVVFRLNLTFTFDDNTEFNSTTLYQKDELKVY